jgi:SEC-C motif-containing protein
MKKCFCGNDKPFSGCCAPVIKGSVKADSAEKLMRSRYSAYVIREIDYIIETTHVSERVNLIKKEIEDWTKATNWQRLEIVYSDEYTVEFKAHYKDLKGKNHTHHERSRFVFEQDRWYYLNGLFP